MAREDLTHDIKSGVASFKYVLFSKGKALTGDRLEKSNLI